MGKRKFTEHAVPAIVVAAALMFEAAAASSAFAYGPPPITQAALLGALVLVNVAALGWYTALRGRRRAAAAAVPPRPPSPPGPASGVGTPSARDVALLLGLSLPLWAFGGALVAECWPLWFHGGYIHIPPLVSRLLVAPFLLLAAVCLWVALFLSRLGLRALRSVLSRGPAPDPRIGTPQAPPPPAKPTGKRPSRVSPPLWASGESPASLYISAIMCAALGLCGAWFFWWTLGLLQQDRAKHVPHDGLPPLLVMLGISVVGLLAAAVFLAYGGRRR